VKQILNYSIKNNLRHIPSALSQYSYLKYILPEIDYKNTNISIGKPFGSQAYYVIWEKMNLCKQPLNYGVKHEELNFVNFSEETLGNAIGVASGLEFANKKKTWCNISDGALQMGATLEAIQFIGKYKQNILLTIDFNGVQLTGKTDKIMNIDIHQQKKIFKLYDWDTYIIDTQNISDENIQLIKTLIHQNTKIPTVILFKTIKGQGVKEMENDPVKWHYKELKDINEITII